MAKIPRETTKTKDITGGLPRVVEEREYSLPRGKHINVQEGERVEAGDPLMDDPRNPHDILDVRGEKELQKYLVNEIQEVYQCTGCRASTSTTSTSKRSRGR